jgi:hypothetical protein
MHYSMIRFCNGRCAKMTETKPIYGQHSPVCTHVLSAMFASAAKQLQHPGQVHEPLPMVARERFLHAFEPIHEPFPIVSVYEFAQEPFPIQEPLPIVDGEDPPRLIQELVPVQEPSPIVDSPVSNPFINWHEFSEVQDCAPTEPNFASKQAFAPVQLKSPIVPQAPKQLLVPVQALVPTTMGPPSTQHSPELLHVLDCTVSPGALHAQQP